MYAFKIFRISRRNLNEKKSKEKQELEEIKTKFYDKYSIRSFLQPEKKTIKSENKQDFMKSHRNLNEFAKEFSNTGPR